MTPERYKDAKWDDLPKGLQDKFRAAALENKGVYLYGPVGCGKTHAAYALAQRMKEVGHTVPAVWNVTQLIHDIKLDMDRRDKMFPAEDLLDAKARTLILDDLGAERMTDWVAETIYLIINSYYVNVRQLIITSNLAPAELADRVGDRIASRVVEMCEIVKLDGTDRRLQK